MTKDFSSKVRRAAKQASNNGKCWWVERYILNSYLWRGPNKLRKYTKQLKEPYHDEEENEVNLQSVNELCESS